MSGSRATSLFGRRAAAEMARLSPDSRLLLCCALPRRVVFGERLNQIVSDIEDNIETRCFFFHGRSPASAKAGDHFKPTRAIVRDQSPQRGRGGGGRGGWGALGRGGGGTGGELGVGELTRFGRESHRVATAAFEARKVDPSPVDVDSSPRGRILPSLVPEESYVVRSETLHQPRQRRPSFAGAKAEGSCI